MKKESLSFLIMALALLFVTSSALAQRGASRSDEWLQFRGPNGAGVAEAANVPAEFGARKNLAWKTSVPFARSSPVVTASRIFLTASDGDKLITLALDRNTGKVVWRRDVARPRHMQIYKANDAASPTPVS